MKVSNLEGENLDYWVAKALGWHIGLVGPKRDEPVWKNDDGCIMGAPHGRSNYPFEPSHEWNKAGPIIEREEIGLQYLGRSGKKWFAGTCTSVYERRADGFGPTPLIAAMRCFVALKFGHEVPAETTALQDDLEGRN